MYKPNFDSGAQLNPDDEKFKRGNTPSDNMSNLNNVLFRI